MYRERCTNEPGARMARHQVHEKREIFFRKGGVVPSSNKAVHKTNIEALQMEVGSQAPTSIFLFPTKKIWMGGMGWKSRMLPTHTAHLYGKMSVFSRC